MRGREVPKSDTNNIYGSLNILYNEKCSYIIIKLYDVYIFRSITPQSQMCNKKCILLVINTNSLDANLTKI